MRIIAMSDIHGRFSDFDPASMPPADLVVVAGDITTRGMRNQREFRASEVWLRELAKSAPVFWIAGNHDLLMPPDVYYPLSVECGVASILDQRADFGGLSFWGVSMSPAYDMPELASQWAHMTCRREVEEAAYALIPPRIDVVISHCPPWLMLDKAGYLRNPDGSWEKRSIGSVELRRYIEREQPRIVICGHVHGAAGHVRYGATDVYNVAETWRLVEIDATAAVGGWSV